MLSHMLTSQKVLSGSGRAGRLRLMGKYIDHRLVARPEPDNTFRTDSTYSRGQKWLTAGDFRFSIFVDSMIKEKKPWWYSF